MEGEFFNPDRPAGGKEKRCRTYGALIESVIFKHPAVYETLLAGAASISMCMPSGDLDIVCESHDPDDFEALSGKLHGEIKGFPVVCPNYPRREAACVFAVKYEMTRIFAYATSTRVSVA